MSAKPLADASVWARINHKRKSSTDENGRNHISRIFLYKESRVPPSIRTDVLDNWRASASLVVRNWLLPGNCVDSKPARTAKSDIFHPYNFKGSLE